MTTSWQTKPTDRFVLRWIKLHLSSHLTQRIQLIPWVRPWMITLAGSLLGVAAGACFALGMAWLAGVLTLTSQVLDGVDGQYARLTKRESRAGAFLDSIMDRYADGAIVMGLTVYLVRLSLFLPLWAWLTMGFMALAGTGLVSYTTARAEVLGLSMGKPTLASKGTRNSVIALCGLAGAFWAEAPAVAMIYLALHTNGLVLGRILRAYRQCTEDKAHE
ncbi:MAG: CDP-alcohol phosphatidyltransferase family protein [bacterium]